MGYNGADILSQKHQGAGSNLTQTAIKTRIPALVERASAINGHRRLLLFALLTALVAAVYLLVNRSPGFPLDDAWIHQDFARTLAQDGRFAFAPTSSGAGSTSPLWVLLLAPAQLVHNAPLWWVLLWAYALGALALFGLAWATSELAALWLEGVDARWRDFGALVAGVGVIAEWHLTWAALSGMETILFILLSVLLLLGVGRAWHPAWLGALGALLTDTRPEGVLLVGLVVVALVLDIARTEPGTGWGVPEEGLGGRRPLAAILIARGGVLRPATFFLAVVALGVLPLLVLNEAASGHLLPSTFYAKGTFYSLGTTELQRLADYALGVLNFLVSSPVVALGLPGALYLLWQSRRSPLRGTRWLAIGWVLALIGGYAIHLPVVYQNGRYLMPVLPVLLALGVAGTLRYLSAASFRLLPPTLAVLALGLGLLSIGRGATIYALNIRFINGYQVQTALWLRDHTQPGALVATHDIGAIGYFSQRPVIDLGGLTQPELVPLLSDQQALVVYLKQQQVDYVVMFPDWFPPPRLLLQAVEPGQVYIAHDPAIAAIGGSDLVTYRTGWGKRSGGLKDRWYNSLQLPQHRSYDLGVFTPLPLEREGATQWILAYRDRLQSWLRPAKGWAAPARWRWPPKASTLPSLRVIWTR
jgi:hypothetical protein